MFAAYLAKEVFSIKIICHIYRDDAAHKYNVSCVVLNHVTIENMSMQV